MRRAASKVLLLVAPNILMTKLPHIACSLLAGTAQTDDDHTFNIITGA
jgi:hypothetical protein